jgi:hypothetical protein
MVLFFRQAPRVEAAISLPPADDHLSVQRNRPLPFSSQRLYRASLTLNHGPMIDNRRQHVGPGLVADMAKESAALHLPRRRMRGNAHMLHA